MAETLFYDVSSAVYNVTAIGGILSLEFVDPTVATGIRGGDGTFTTYVIDGGRVEGILIFKDLIEANALAGKHEEEDLVMHCKNNLGVDYVITLTDIAVGGAVGSITTPAQPVRLQFIAQAIAIAAAS